MRWIPHNRNKGPLCPEEIIESEERIIRIVQNESYGSEISLLRKQTPLHKDCVILKLDPFIDEKGILRVGGRIQLSALSFDEKHPIILPQKHTFTRLLIKHMHNEVMHGGLGLTLQKLRQRYWVIGARVTATTVIHECMICFRFRKQMLTQKMGNLPISCARNRTIYV